jgi:deoxyribonuclease V
MFAALDAQYVDHSATVACVTFSDWAAEEAQRELVTTVDGVAEYQPGEFWRREVPGALAVLALLERKPDLVVVDGYVWLDGAGRKGMGAHLFDALNGAVAVIGVAKHSFAGSPHAALVHRGESDKPLFVTAQGMPLEQAQQAIAAMHGPFRIPTLLKRVDQLCRRSVAPRST